MRPLFPLLIVVAVLAGGCAKAKAQVEPEMPVLAPPPPPPRVVAVYAEPEPVPAVEPEPAETTQAPRPRPNRPAGTRNDAGARPEPAPSQPPVRPTTPPPSVTLKPAVGSEAKTEASIRDLVGRAGRDLGRANYAALDSDGRAQYDTAKRFLQQAEEALKSRNYVFAGKLADKAATLAAVLVR